MCDDCGIYSDTECLVRIGMALEQKSSAFESTDYLVSKISDYENRLNEVRKAWSELGSADRGAPTLAAAIHLGQVIEAPMSRWTA